MTENLKREFEYSLQVNISIHKNGEKQFANKIKLLAPSSAQRTNRCIIKQAFMNAGKKSGGGDSSGSSQTQTSDDQDIEITNAEQVAGMLYSNLDYNEISRVMEAFIDLLTSGCGIALEERLTTFHIDQIDSEDLDNMLGEYIVNFLIPSWMKRLMKM